MKLVTVIIVMFITGVSIGICSLVLIGSHLKDSERAAYEQSTHHQRHQQQPLEQDTTNVPN